MITASIIVNLSGEPQLIRVPAKQGDVGSREVNIKFVDNGVIYIIPEGTTARIRVTKPDGKYIFNDCTIEDNAVIAPLTAQTLAVAGDARADIALYQGENVLLSCSVFILAITPRAGSDEAVESADEFGVLDNLLQQAETDIQAAHNAAETANTAAGEANSAAEAARDITAEVEEKLENGDFVGPQGPPGSLDNVTGAATSILTNNLTENRTLISDENGKVSVSTVTSTELEYLSGATGSIQEQINGKQGEVNGAASTITESNLTENRALVSDENGKVAVSGITSTELGYLSGATKNIQEQITELNDDLGALGNVRLNASGSNGDVRINGYTNLQLYLISVNVGGKYFQVPHLGNTGQSISHYVVYGNGNLTYFWFEVQADGTVRFVQSWSTNGGWISNPDYTFAVYQVMGIQGK